MNIENQHIFGNNLPPVAEKQGVSLTVEIDLSEDLLALAAQVYDGLSDEEIDEVEKIALDRRKFFEKTK